MKRLLTNSSMMAALAMAMAGGYVEPFRHPSVKPKPANVPIPDHSDLRIAAAQAKRERKAQKKNKTK